MKTITMTIDEEVLQNVEKKAAALQTSVSEVAADLLAQWAATEATADARRAMTARFAQPDWQFAVGTPDDREQRNERR